MAEIIKNEKNTIPHLNNCSPLYILGASVISNTAPKKAMINDINPKHINITIHYYVYDGEELLLHIFPQSVDEDLLLMETNVVYIHT